MIAIRIIAACALFISAVMFPWWVVGVFALVYAFAFRAYELLILAAIVDGYFGAGLAIPYYTITAFVFVLVAEWLKPSLSIFNTTQV